MGTVTADINTRAGSGIISMKHGDLPDGVSFDVSEISEVEISFDLEEDSNESSNVYFSPSEFEFTCFDEMGDGSSLFLTLDGILSTESINVILDFTTDGGHSITDKFEFQTSDVEYNRSRRSVTIKSSAVIKHSNNVQEIFSTYSGDIAPQDTDDFDASIMKAYDFVKNYFDLVEPSTVYVDDSYSLLNLTAENDLQESWVILNRNRRASTVVYKLATLEGAMVGSIFGYSFFVNRLSTNESIQLSEDDVEELDINIGLNSYYEISLSFVERTDPATLPASDGVLNTMAYFITSDNSNLNPDGTKRLSVFFEANNTITRAVYATFDNQFNRTVYDEWSEITDPVAEGSDVIPVSDTSVFSVGDLIHIRDITSSGYQRDAREIYKVTYISSNNNEIFIDRPLVKSYEETAWYQQGGTTISSPPTVRIFSPPMLDPEILEKGVNCYKKAYGADGANTANLTVFDLDRIKPYQAIELGSSFPEAVRNQYYRPSNIVYDLMADKVELEVYAIS